MIVLDSDAATSLLFERTEGNALKALMLQGETIIAPELLRVEVANTLRKYVQFLEWDDRTAHEKLRKAYAFVDKYYADESLISEAYSESIRLGHAVQDMLYFVLARRTSATLYTLDKKLQKICVNNGVECVYAVKLD